MRSGFGRTLGIAGTLVAGALPVRAQDPAFPSPEGATEAVGEWLALVRAGAGDASRHTASLRFRYRVGEYAWQRWVEKQSEALRELRPRRAVTSTLGRDEEPLEPLDWVRVVYASERPDGGTVFERVVAVREEDGVWRVADYGAWADSEAMVNNAAIEPVPYRDWYLPSLFVHGWRGRLLPGHRGRDEVAPPAPPSSRANPRTFPRRTPTGR